MEVMQEVVREVVEVVEVKKVEVKVMVAEVMVVILQLKIQHLTVLKPLQMEEVLL